MYPLMGALGLLEVTKGVANVFKDSKANAKLAGMLLGFALALREPFRSQSVSLVGFSLGCQVIKSCLKTLRFLGAFDVVQNVTFLGAAIDRPDRHKNVNKIMAVFSQVISGRIKNVYTKKDWVLAALYSGCEMDQAMGRCPVFTEQFFISAGMTSPVRANLFGRIGEVVPLTDSLLVDDSGKENDDEIVLI